MREFIPLASPDIRDQDIDRVVNVLKSGMLVQGKQVAELETKFCEWTGAKHAVAVSNGTASLHLALIAHGIGPGDEVIIPALSYIATANVVEIVGATPVFIDTHLRTFNIKAADIEAAITPRTKAIMPVHEFGLCCEIDTIVEIAANHDLVVIEDAACALGAIYKGKHAGTFGQCGSFSLHPRKAITSGEGGMLVTNNDDLAKQFRMLRNHGVDPEVTTHFEFGVAGLNYRLTDIQAALPIGQFERFGSTMERKHSIATRYEKELKNDKFLKPVVAEVDYPSWQTYHIILDSTLERADVIDTLRAAGIGANLGAQCMPEQTHYKNKYNLDSQSLYPNALLAFTHGLAVPLYEKMSDDEVTHIINTLNKL